VGDTHEAMNFAGVHRLPVVFFCENNRYAISVPLDRQMAVDSVSARAAGYGFPGVTVDGTDPVAVYEAMVAAVARARSGDGPSLVEVRESVCGAGVVRTDGPGRCAHLGRPARCVTQIVPERGPMGGLHAGLMAIEAPFALAVACDMPFLNPRLLRYMVGLPQDYEALVPIIRGRWQPLHAIYAKACLAAVEELLARGLLALTDLLSQVRVRALPFAAARRFDPQGLSFLNLNEPHDLLRARAVEPASDTP
jgi:molybdopterin-guanine dinucleotide biosynthesis protein A